MQYLAIIRDASFFIPTAESSKYKNTIQIIRERHTQTHTYTHREKDRQRETESERERKKNK